MTEVSAEQTSGRDIPLSDVMLAMDVVDTLRHRQSLIDRELDAATQEQAIVEKVKAIYAAQGIEVSDRVISEAVKALKEQRFAYSPAPPGFKTRLYQIYIDRGRWFRRLLAVVAAGVFIWGLYFGFVGLPERQAKAALQTIPAELNALRSQALQLAELDDAKARADGYHEDGLLAVKGGETDAANQAQRELQSLIQQLQQEYTVEVIYRPGESSGIWRIPPNNDNARNYYLIVEAIDERGQRLKVPIRSEEDQRTRLVDKWGIRVPEHLFNAMRDDKQDDGIIQNNRVGTKRRGLLEPEYSVDTRGGAITQW